MNDKVFVLDLDGQLRYLDVYCMRPNTGQCSAPNGMAIEIIPSVNSQCIGEEFSFRDNPETRRMLHICTGQYLCADSGREDDYIRTNTGCDRDWDIGMCKSWIKRLFIMLWVI